MKNQSIRYYETCPKCSTSITKQNFKRHFNTCKGTGKVFRVENKYCNYCNAGPFNSFKEWNAHKTSCSFFLDRKDEKDSLGRSKHVKSNFHCSFCGKLFENKRLSDVRLHERCCQANPNRVDGTFKGKKHSLDSKEKIAKSVAKAHDEGRGHTWKNKYLNPSYAEQWLYDVLINANIQFEKEKPFKGFFLDVVVGNKVIEIDGEQHYLPNEFPEQIERDQRKDKLLKEEGYQELRIRWSDVKKDSKKFAEIIVNFLR